MDDRRKNHDKVIREVTWTQNKFVRVGRKK